MCFLSGSTSSHPLLPSGLNTDFTSQLDKSKTVAGSTWTAASTERTTSQSSSSGNLVQLTEGGGTPVNDEGNSTPVQDEQPDSAQSCNPIEFLTQLISQSQKTPPAATSFFQNLTALTEKVKQSKIKPNQQDLASDQMNQSTSSGEDYVHGTTPPAPPAWESWTADRETPSYVPDTRPTPGLPFGEVPAPAHSEPYSGGSQTQNMDYGTDVQQDDLYTSVQRVNSQTYTAGVATAAQQPYDVESKPQNDSFSSQPTQPVLYSTDPQNPSTHSVDPQPPPPTPSYGTDVPYVQPDQQQQSSLGAPSLFSSGTAPPPPPVTVEGTGNNGMPSSQGQSQYTPQFYQEVPVSPSAGSGQMPQNSNTGLPPATPPVNMSETPPLPFPPLPPTSSWSQPVFSGAPPFSSAPSMFMPHPPPAPINASASVGECPKPPYPPTGCTSSINSSSSKGMPISFNASGSGIHDHADFGQRNQVSQQQQEQQQQLTEGNHSHNIMQRNLAAVPMAGYDSPASTSNPDQDVEVSTIPTMLGKGRPNRPLHPPRPPSHPPRTGGSLRPGQFSTGSCGEEDQQEFIDKLKHKSYSASAPAGPPKSILKSNAHGMRNLRTLTDHEPAQCDGGLESDDLKDGSKESACGASEMDMDFENAGNNQQVQADLGKSLPNRDWSAEPLRPHDLRAPLPGHLGPPFRGQRPEPPWSSFRRDPQYPPNRMLQPFDLFRDNHGRPFPKRHPPPFEFRHQRFPRY